MTSIRMQLAAARATSLMHFPYAVRNRIMPEYVGSRWRHNGFEAETSAEASLRLQTLHSCSNIP